MGKSERQAGKREGNGGFNTPFKGLKSALRKPPEPPRPAAAPPPGAAAASRSGGGAGARPPPPAPTRPPRPPPRANPAAAEDERLFALAMAGVSRLADDHGVAPPPPPRPAVEVPDEEAEALAHLADLVSGEGPFDIADSDEYIEGSAPGVDRRIVESLRRGDFAVQAHVDLHGMTRAQAKETVDAFLTGARLHGHRCVLIVHGRGLNSKDQIPVLKEQLNVWLRRGRIGREVLAFATARPHDGGAGAVYVLLRR